MGGSERHCGDRLGPGFRETGQTVRSEGFSGWGYRLAVGTERKAHPWSESAASCPSLDPGIGLYGQGPQGPGQAVGVSLGAFPCNHSRAFLHRVLSVVSGDWRPGNLRGCLQDAAGLGLGGPADSAKGHPLGRSSPASQSPAACPLRASVFSSTGWEQLHSRPTGLESLMVSTTECLWALYSGHGQACSAGLVCTLAGWPPGCQ